MQPKQKCGPRRCEPGHNAGAEGKEDAAKEWREERKEGSAVGRGRQDKCDGVCLGERYKPSRGTLEHSGTLCRAPDIGWGEPSVSLPCLPLESGRLAGRHRGALAVTGHPHPLVARGNLFGAFQEDKLPP